MRWWKLRSLAKPFSRANGEEEGTSQGASGHGDAVSRAHVPPASTAPQTAQLIDVTLVASELAFHNNDDCTELLGADADADGIAATLGVDPSSDTATKLTAVAGYDIFEELGRGGMGVVYRARHRNLQRQVALKMILAGAHAGEAGLARFRAEAEAVAQLQHPNIVQVFEIGEHDGCPYFSLELVTGGNLADRIRESPLSPQAAARLIETLARAIGFAHQRGIIHRDLKPANILLATDDPQSTMVASGLSSVRRSSSSTSTISSSGDWTRSIVPKITDFGLAKRLDDDSSQTNTGTVLGTPNYMSPEQASGRVRDIGPATDIYALGAIFYELLIGRPPFKAGNPIDVIRQVIDQEPVPPRQLEPRVPLDIETICLKCLDKQPSRRYQTAEELANDLQRFLADEPILARPVSATERAWKWAKRRPSTVALMAVCVAAVIGTVMFVVWHNVSLKGKLDAAIAQERQSRERAEAVEEAQRLSQIQIEGQRLYDDARVSVADDDLPAAQLDLTKALTILGSEPGLDTLREAAETLLGEVKQKLEAALDRQASRERLKHFVQLRDEAQFLGTLYTGMELAANLHASREAVREALAVYGVSVDYDPTLTVDEYLEETEQTQIRSDCYQLLLILAETESQTAAVLDEQEQRSHLEEALRVLDLAPRFGTPSKAYQLRRARYLSALGDRNAAAEAEQLAEAAEVTNALDHFLIADEQYRRGDYGDAIGEFERVLQSQPDHFWAQYLCGLCLLRQSRPAEARSHLTACIAQGRDFVWLYLLRGFANGELKAFEAADADFRQAEQMARDENSRYVLFVNRGVLRIRQDRLEESVADLNEAIKLKPTGYQAFVNLAQAYRQQRDLDRALAQLDLAVASEPSRDHLYRLRARLRVERLESNEALKDFDTAIGLASASNPLLADDYVERGRLLLLAGKQEEALKSLDAALHLNNHHSLAQRLRGEALFRLGRFEEVITAFDRYLETGKPLESVYRGRGLAKSELGAFPGAIEDFTKALELQPTSAVQAYRGWMYLVVNANELAERDFALAIELGPNNGDAYNGRGFVRAIQGNIPGAIEDAEKALKLGPRSPQLVYNAARIYAQSALPGDARVFELIGESLSLMPQEERSAFWFAQVCHDAALDSIRRRPQYMQIERELLTKN